MEPNERFRARREDARRRRKRRRAVLVGLLLGVTATLAAGASFVMDDGSTVAAGTKPATEKAKPCYSNYNFSVFRILLPKVAGFLETDPTKLAAKYVELVQNSVFEPVGISNVACGPPKLGSGAGAYAFSYAFPGTSAGHDWGDNTLGCGHAGWYLSVQDIAQVLISLNSQDGRVLSTTQFQNMESMQLGWDMTTVNGYRFVEKNGGWGAGGTSLSTSIAIIGPAPGIVGVLFINSDITREPNVGADIVLRQAVMKALRPKQ